MTARQNSAIAARRALLALTWTLGASVALLAGPGCNSTTDASKSDATTATITTANTPPPEPARTAKTAGPRGRQMVDTTSRREHQRQMHKQ